jgi:AcrR family transcriptional regulator
MAKNDEAKMSVAERKAYIMEEATALFYKNGYDNTSIRELAKATGLSVAGVYYFYEDKEEILFSILNQSIIDLNDTLRISVCEGDDPFVNIRRIIENLLKHGIRHKMEISILNREDGRLNAEQKETINTKRREAYALLKKELSRLEKRGELKSKSLTTAVFAIFSMATWFSRWYDPNGSQTLAEIANEMTDMFFTGILKERG